MNQRPINAQAWMLPVNLSQAVEVTNFKRMLFLSGQTATDAQGVPQHDGDLKAQFKLAWENLVANLMAADMQASNIVRLNVYTTDPDGVMANFSELSELWAKSCKPACTLLGVKQLFVPSIPVELEATAAA